MLNGPLEETMGKLVDVFPAAATEMLQRRGLVVMPMAFAEELLEQKLDVQGQFSVFDTFHSDYLFVF